MGELVICRVCESPKSLETLFRRENEILLMMLKSVSSLSILPDDCLPRCICTECVQKLLDAYNFKIQCENTDRKWRKIRDKAEYILLNHKTQIKHEENNPPNDACIKVIEFDHNYSKSADKFEPFICTYAVRQKIDLKYLEMVKRAKASNTKSENNYEPNMLMPIRQIQVKQNQTMNRRNKCERLCKKTESVPNIPLLSNTIVKEEVIFDSDVECVDQTNEEVSINIKKSLSDEETEIECEVCNKIFSSNDTFNDHTVNGRCTVKTVRGSHLRCDICFESFTESFQLDQHCLSHAISKPFKCEHCDKKFARNSALKQHQQIHSNPQMFEIRPITRSNKERCTKKDNTALNCDRCYEKFSHFNDLQRHSIAQHKRRLLQCLECKKPFRLYSTLMKHKMKHFGRKSTTQKASHTSNEMFKSDQLFGTIKLEPEIVIDIVKQEPVAMDETIKQEPETMDETVKQEPGTMNETLGQQQTCVNSELNLSVKREDSDQEEDTKPFINLKDDEMLRINPDIFQHQNQSCSSTDEKISDWGIPKPIILQINTSSDYITID